MPQRDTFLIMGLHRKRARLAGEIEAAERRLVPVREALAHVDSLIRLFEGSDPELIPAIRPAPRCLFFRHGEQRRLCLDALREGGKPMKAGDVARYVILAKGIPAEDWRVRAQITDHVRIALKRLEGSGQVRRVLVAPDAAPGYSHGSDHRWPRRQRPAVPDRHRGVPGSSLSSRSARHARGDAGSVGGGWGLA